MLIVMNTLVYRDPCHLSIASLLMVADRNETNIMILHKLLPSMDRAYPWGGCNICMRGSISHASPGSAVEPIKSVKRFWPTDQLQVIVVSDGQAQ